MRCVYLFETEQREGETGGGEGNGEEDAILCLCRGDVRMFDDKRITFDVKCNAFDANVSYFPCSTCVC